MATATDAPESWYLALLGFAEHFRTSSPPKIRLCVHCLKAVFQFKPSQRVEARTHLQLGSVLYQHTKNTELARTHLEKAVRRITGGSTGEWSAITPPTTALNISFNSPGGNKTIVKLPTCVIL